MHLKNLSILLAITIMCFGCGNSGGGDSSDLPPERPYTQTTGYAVDAVITGGTVTAYSWANGVKGDALGQDQTDDDGYYTITMQAQPQPILLELVGGSYVEEASGKTVSLRADQVMYAAINYGGEPIDVMITPYTTLAKGLAQYYIDNAGFNVEHAITTATSEITGITVFNILNEYPLNITFAQNQTDTLTDGHMYGFFCAALSSWAAELSELNGTDIHSTYTSIYLTQIMYRDVLEDGVLNGEGLAFNGRPGSLSIGTVGMDSQLYRLKIGQHIILAAGADYNQTGMTVDDVLTQAVTFSQRVNGLFGYVDPMALDADGPDVYNTVGFGRRYRGVMQYSFDVEDIVGISTLSVTLDGDPVDSVTPTGTYATVTVEIDTTEYTDGDHTLEIVATDMLDNQSVHQHNLVFNNTGILLNIDALPEITRTLPQNITGTWETTGTSIESITINGNQANIGLQDHTFDLIINLQRGVNEIEIVATDTIGNTNTEVRTINCDLISPLITTNNDHGFHRFYLASFDDVGSFILHDENTGNPLYFTYSNTSLNGLDIDPFELSAAEIPFFKVIVTDPPDEGVSTPDADLNTRMEYRRGTEVLTTRTLTPTEEGGNTYLIPLVTEYLTDDFYQSGEDEIHTIIVRANDAAGNGTSKLLSFKAYVEAGEVTVRSLNNTSTVTVYAFDTGTKGGIIAQGETTAQGAATLKLFSTPRPILVELTEGYFRELGTSRQVQMIEGQSLSAVAMFDGTDQTINVTPLTDLAAARAEYQRSAHPTVEQAVNDANSYVSNMYGVDVLHEDIVNISDPASATGQVNDAYRHSFVLAGLSSWTSDAAEASGAYGQQTFNSILLAEKLSEDMTNDGQLNGGIYFGSVLITQDTYGEGFGQAISDVVTSYTNNTSLDLEDIVGVDMAVADGPQEAQRFGISFANRTSTVNQEILTAEYTLMNRLADKPLFVAIEPTEDQSACRHEYYDAVREHVVRRHRELRYRGRTWAGGWDISANNFCGWQTITKYATWENDRWTTIDLPATEAININIDSDTMPADRYQDWEYFITETVGAVKNYALSSTNPNHDLVSRTGTRSDQTKYERVYDYYMEEYNHCYANPSSADSHQWYQTAWKHMIQYTGPHQTSQYGDWSVNSSQFQYLTTYLNDVVTPQIQRDYLESYTVVTAPHNEITAEYDETHSFQNVRYVAENSSGGAALVSNGYYVIPSNSVIVIKKYVTTPNIALYSDGAINYVPNTYDQTLTYTIDKNIALTVRQGVNSDILNQVPTYELAHSGTQTYTITR